MKKALSIFLALLMLSAVFALPASAAAYPPSSCDCVDHDKSGALCDCCLFCENLNPGRVTTCVEFGEDANGKRIIADICCADCKGVQPCDCACSCCSLTDAEKEELNKEPDKIFTEDQQETIIEAFQRILSQIAEFFDTFFNAIFEFLRFDDIMGGNN